MSNLNNQTLLIENAGLLEIIDTSIFGFDNIKYYEELNPVVNDSIHNGKLIRIHIKDASKLLYKKYIHDIPKIAIKNLDSFQKSVVQLMPLTIKGVK